MKPSYIALFESGALSDMTARIGALMKSCTLCPHRCRVDRTAGEKGKCRTGDRPVISAFHAHFGEERCLVGRGGSGTIFFTNCNLSCVFCQNYDISQLGGGEECTYEELASIMLSLQSKGCENINFVSPTHMIYPILKSLLLAVPRGLALPLVYNSGGYDSAAVLRQIAGVFDIYMPDLKFMDPESAARLCGAEDYPVEATAAVREMHSQVGDLVMDRMGVAQRGLLVRHLVLPENLAATDRVIAFLASLSPDTYLNLMDQYRPEYRAREHRGLGRRVTLQEYDEAVSLARSAGLKRLDA